MSDIESRTPPGRQPDHDVAAIRALRKATRDYIIVLEAGLVALTDDAIAGNPALASSSPCLRWPSASAARAASARQSALSERSRGRSERRRRRRHDL